MNLKEILEQLNLDSNLLGPLIFLAPLLFRFLRGLVQKAPQEGEPESAKAKPAKRSAAERIIALHQARLKALRQARTVELEEDNDNEEEDQDEQLAVPGLLPPPNPIVPEATLPDSWLPKAAGRRGPHRIDAALIVGAVRWEAVLSPKKSDPRAPPC